MNKPKTVAERSEIATKEWTDQAEQALQQADVAKLRKLVADACKHNLDLSKAFDGMLMVYADSGKAERRALSVNESESAIAAMRDVALAAIELCKATTGK